MNHSAHCPKRWGLLRSTSQRLGAMTLSLLAATALAAPAHEHGVATLDVAVEARRITVQLESPLDNLLGFERAPRTDKERKVAADAIARLRNAAALFVIDPAAGCKAGAVQLESTPLGLGAAAAAGKASEHGDLDASFEFECFDTARARYIDVALFAFEHLQRVRVQGVTPQGQFKRELTKGKARIELQR